MQVLMGPDDGSTPLLPELCYSRYAQIMPAKFVNLIEFVELKILGEFEMVLLPAGGGYID